MACYTAIGVMSGSSMDGLDLCCVRFTGDVAADTWEHEILQATTLPYSPSLGERLGKAEKLAAVDLIKLDVDYGHYLGDTVAKFITEHRLNVDLVASHGHTVFHQPDRGFTLQVGDGETMVSHLGIPLVANFRNKDVALGGEGAPLVPGGERHLFNQYDICLNLGGICNISVGEQGFDVSPCNMALNYLARMKDPSLEYDGNGKIAAEGTVVNHLLKKLNALDFYQESPPKSLGKEWFDENITGLFDQQQYRCEDMMRTFVEHIAEQITDSIRNVQQTEEDTHRTMLVTGGGALNPFLMTRLKGMISEKNMGIVVTNTDEDTVNFKEALVFAFLGLRTLLCLTNVFKDVTGAKCDSVSGSVHLPPVNNVKHALFSS